MGICIRRGVAIICAVILEHSVGFRPSGGADWGCDDVADVAVHFDRQKVIEAEG